MTTPAMVSGAATWRSVRAEVLRRIQSREWRPGDPIPNEADLAQEFGCARATVNRALRSLADDGLLDRRRKAGTRVAAQPVAKATIDIPLIRREIEAQGRRYGYRRLSRTVETPPAAVAAAMATPWGATPGGATPAGSTLLRVEALHLADEAPYALEDRWINLDAAPDAAEESFEAISGNEWLLAHIPYAAGEIAFEAARPTPAEAARLACAPDAALFAIDRMTRTETTAITRVRLLFAPGYRLSTAL